MKHTFFHGFSMGSSCEPRFVCTADVRTCRILLAVSSCSQQSHTGSTCTKKPTFHTCFQRFITFLQQTQDPIGAH